MFSEYSSNVILAKTRAMYGKRLKHSDYDTLLNCKSVFEIASYLKNNTSYSKTLALTNESEVHRGDLEFILKNKSLTDLASLLRYEKASGDAFSDYIVAKIEIEQIINTLMRISSSGETFLPRNLPPLFDKHSKIKLSTLTHARTYDEFLMAIRNSSYKKLFKDIKPDENGCLNLSQIEYILYNYLYKILFSSIESTSNATAKNQLNDIFRTYINFRNFVRIVRNKRNKNKSYDFMIMDFGSLSKKHLDKMIKAASEKEAFEIMASIPQGRFLNKIEYGYVDQIPFIVRHKMCIHEIHSSVSTAVVLMSYIFLMENELSNIIKIIEGIRYSLPKSEISKLLIL